MKSGHILGLGAALGLGVLIGYLLWGWWARPALLPEKQGYDIFRDLITLILAVGGIVVATAGYFIYVIVLEKTREAAASAAEEQMHSSSATLLVHIAYSYWFNYHFRKTADINDLTAAIRFTESAYDNHARYLDERKHERLLCHIRNNLAYYYAELGLPKDRRTALKFAEYLEERIGSYSAEDRKEWNDTVQFVREKYASYDS